MSASKVRTPAKTALKALCATMGWELKIRQGLRCSTGSRHRYPMSGGIMKITTVQDIRPDPYGNAFRVFVTEDGEPVVASETRPTADSAYEDACDVLGRNWRYVVGFFRSWSPKYNPECSLSWFGRNRRWWEVCQNWDVKEDAAIPFPDLEWTCPEELELKAAALAEGRS